jgi:anaerobic selenocysteine-containing dehydrogenase
MTNHWVDIKNADLILIMGGNAAEAHPVSMQHVLAGKEINRANVIVFDPRMTRTAAHATEYVRIRSGTDIAVIWGMMWHIFRNGWEDKEFISQRVYGLDDVRKEVEKYDPKTVEDITGVPEAQLKRAAETFAICMSERMPSCMRAPPPEALMMISGSFSTVARSVSRARRSPTTLPMLPMMNDESVTPTATRRARIMPVPVRAASERPVRFCSATSRSA